MQLRLLGGRDTPDPAGLALAHDLSARFDALVPQIQASLFEHYEPYGQAASHGEQSELFPKIEQAQDVWPHVSPTHVLIEPLRGSPTDGPTIEIAYTVHHITALPRRLATITQL